jgi:hypothetical protein
MFKKNKGGAKVIKFRVVFKAFTDKLTVPQKVEFSDLCKKFNDKDLSFILGGGVRQQRVEIPDITLLDKGGVRQGIQVIPIYILTVCIAEKNILSHEELEQDHEKMLIYMKEFIEAYTIEIVET